MKQTLTVAVMGDICLHDISDRITPERSRALLREAKPLLARADVRVANLENAVEMHDTPIRKCGPNLWQTREALCFVKEAGIDCNLLANNHVGDFGPAAVEETIRILDEETLGHTGAGRGVDAAYMPWYTECEGGKLAICAFCENEFGGATLTEWGVAGFDLHRAALAIREAKQNADYVLVIMHGGNEYNPLPSPGARGRYRTFVDLGADAVVGMHPHCMQGTEYYNGAPIVYSPGNFIFPDMHVGPCWYRGYMVELTFQKGEIPSLTLHPYVFGPELELIHFYEGEEKQTVLAYVEHLSSFIQDETALRAYFDGWCVAYGKSYAAAPFDASFLENPDQEIPRSMLAFRNGRTCEAHNEVVTQLGRIIVEGRMREAQAIVPKIRELQKMPL